MRLSRARTAIAAALVSAVVAWATPAAAEEDAAVHYKKGRSLYNVSEYRAALDEFKQAYVLHEDPAFLYNIAQCHRQLGNHREAITFYKRFLNESPRAANRREIERLIAELEEKAATAPRVPAPAPVAPAPAPGEPPPQPKEAPVPAAPPSAEPTAVPAEKESDDRAEPRKAAGLHLELGIGAGFFRDGFNFRNLTSGTAVGASGSFQLAATYGVLPNLALGLLFAGESVQSPRVELAGVRTDNVSVGTLGFLGVMADWRPRRGPTGWHVEASGGAARLTVKDKGGILPARTPVGGGGALAAGHDWSLTADWQIGFLVRAMAVYLTDEGTDHHIITASGQFVVGYH